MNKAAIYHRPESEQAFIVNETTIRLRLTTAKGDIKQVQVVAGDPYSLRSLPAEVPFFKQPQSAQLILSDDVHDYWQVDVSVAKRRVAYGFLLTDYQGNTVMYTDKGFVDVRDTERLMDMNTYFRFPFIHMIDAITAPKWVQKTVWYQIFPERFANGDSTNDPAGTLPWDPAAKMTRDAFYGGDLAGVLHKLDHLVKLGVNGIYFTPIFTAPTNHKYDTQNYREIDPHFGDLKLFKQLVAAAHKRGIKVMLDAVFNHIGDQSEQWQDVVKNGKNSRYADWFYIDDFPVHYTPTDNFEFSPDANYATFDYTPHMPKLNTENPEVQEYLLDIAKYWVTECDIDAWRLDVANEIDHHFWRRFATELRQLKPDFYILGEIWHSAQPWLTGTQFSGVMNYNYTEAIMDTFVHKTNTVSQLIARLSQQLMQYQTATNQMMFNTLDSHDTARLLTQAHDNKAVALATLAFTFMQPGTPSLYYGTEYAMRGGQDPDCRRPMQWHPAAPEQEYFKVVQALVNVRRTYWQQLSAGKLMFEKLHDGIKVTRTGAGRTVYGYFNLGARPLTIPLADEEILVQQQFDAGSLAPNGFMLTTRKEESKWNEFLKLHHGTL